MLSINNAHERDQNISFKENGHIYNVKGMSHFTSVTTWVKRKFEKFDADKIIDNMMKSKNWDTSKYFGMTKSEIKESWNKNRDTAASNGTNMHKMFEDYYNNEPMHYYNTESVEYIYFSDFIKEHSHLKPYRTEWMIYDEQMKIAGSIDMVYLNEDGTLSIYDWKRCKSIDKTSPYNKFSIDLKYNYIPDTNYWHYALQLNMYKTILEKNYGFVVSELYLVGIHNELHTTYKKIKVPILNIV